LLASRLKKDTSQYFTCFFLLLAILLPIEILLIRVFQGFFEFGRLIGPIKTILFTFGLMSFLSLAIGVQFSLACKKAKALGRVYLFEVLGFVGGGILFTYALIGNLTILAVSLVLAVFSMFCFLVLSKEAQLKKKVFLISACSIILLAGFKLAPVVEAFRWQGYKVIAQKETRNNNLSLVELGSIKNIFVNGLISASFPDPESYQPAGHWGLLASKSPDNVLIIGNSSLGVLKEILKHNPETVDYAVFDSSLIDFIQPHLEKEDQLALEDRKVNVYYGDERLFIRQSLKKYDLIILDVKEVSSLKLNRFYTEEFYQELVRVLKENGVLSLSVVSSENYLSNQTLRFNASVYRTLSEVFKEIELIPGGSMIFLCSKDEINITEDMILRRYQQRGLNNTYANPAYFKYKLEPIRRQELKELLRSATDIKINKDYEPTTYYYFAHAWHNKFSSPFGRLLISFMLAVLGFFIVRKRKNLARECILIFSLGFAGILIELVLFLGFQISFGQVWWQMGILFASFMLGASLGSALGIKFKNIPLTSLSLGIIGLAGYLYYFMTALPGMVSFSLMLVLLGMIIGCGFIIAGHHIKEDKILNKAGALYSADLWGAAIGALLGANFIIPFFGLFGTLGLAMAMALVGLVGYLIKK